MPLRMSGLMSGMDTEAIVKELMSAQTLKKTKVTKAKTKLEWKQTAWSDLNTKLMKLYNDFVSKMQLESTYKTKKTSVSDTSKANVTANSNAANGSYTLEVSHIATAQYLTGGVIDAESEDTKLTALDAGLLNKEIEITNGDKNVKFAVTADSTLADFTSALKEAGLNANFDKGQKRLTISSKESGLKNTFTLKTSGLTDAEVQARNDLKAAVGYDKMSAANKKAVNQAIETLRTSGVDTDEYNTALDSLAKAAYESKKSQTDASATTYVKAKLYSEKYADMEKEAEEGLKANYYNEDGTLKDGKTEDDYKKAVAKKADTDTTAYVNKEITSSASKLQISEAAFTGKTEADINALGDKAVAAYYKDGVNAFDKMEGVDQDSVKADITAAVSAYASISPDDRNQAAAGSVLNSLGIADISKAADGTVTVEGATPKGMALIKGSDSEIILNGATLTSSSSTVSVNGLSIELTGVTKPNEPITFSVSNDVDGVYDSIKSFLKEYNSVMKEMNTLYNAESAKGYEPLSSDEKEAMSDDEVKLWEDKVKGALLRNDSTLNGIIQGMRSAMMTTVEHEGKRYSLSSFGIMTATDWTEGGQLHIYGDKDDSVYSGQKDKLKTALEEDPDAVIATLTGVFGNLKETMSQKMAGTKYSSALTFYNDIKMKDDLRSYEKEIKEWEDKLATMEENYYKKFTAMETAMAKLQSQQNSLGSILGTNG